MRGSHVSGGPRPKTTNSDAPPPVKGRRSGGGLISDRDRIYLSAKIGRPDLRAP
jgi:hypothetical protein